MYQITSNIVRCNKCGDMIESVYTHDFKCCSCGAVCVDGGLEYLAREGKREDFEERSKTTLSVINENVLKK